MVGLKFDLALSHIYRPHTGRSTSAGAPVKLRMLVALPRSLLPKYRRCLSLFSARATTVYGYAGWTIPHIVPLCRLDHAMFRLCC